MGRSLWRKSGSVERYTIPPIITKASDNPPIFPHFSDVNAIDGHQRHLQTVSLKKSPEICVKNCDQQRPVNLTCFIPFKTLIFRKEAF